LRHLILFPAIGRLQTKSGVRKYIVPRYPYAIQEEIIILSVKHSAQVGK